MIEAHWTKSHIILFFVIYVSICLLIGLITKWYFTHWIIFTSLLSFWILMIIIKTISMYLLYPGSFQFTKANLEIKQSQYLYDYNNQSFSSLSAIMHAISTTPFNKLLKQSYRLQNGQIIKNIHLNTLILKHSNKSKSKNRLKDEYNKLQQLLTKIVNSGSKNTINIADILHDHRAISTINVAQANHHEIMRSYAKQIMQIITKIKHIQNRLMSPANLPLYTGKKPSKLSRQWLSQNQVAKWFLEGQRLFQLDSYYGYWDQYYQYSKYKIELSNNYIIQCAVIHNYLPTDAKNTKHNRQRKVVMFSCPNAVYMQAYGIQNGYMQFYLNLGLQIILWNYRGYGNSTGNPSISKCMKDAEQVYEYCKKQLNLNIVIAHGYSIGAACAINIGSKYSEQLKLVIADRTFSDIQKTATQFIPTNNIAYSMLKSVSKYIIHCFLNSQVVDNSSKYLNISCGKVNIWSLNDQVIKTQASLKVRLLEIIGEQPLSEWFGQGKFVSLQFVGEIMGSPQDESDQLVSSQIVSKPSQIKKNMHNFAQSFALHMNNLINTSEEEYYLLCQQLNIIDGSGVYLPSAMKPVLRYDQSYLTKMHKDYYLGLLVFGPKLAKITNAQFGNKVSSLKNMFHSSNRITLKNFEIQKIIECIMYAKDILDKKILHKKFGDIIVTSDGHNDELRKSKFKQLEAIVTKSLQSDFI